MQKSEVPTSRYQLFCDTFDTKLEVKIHLNDEGKQKLLISIETEDKEKKSISIYYEEVELLGAFLTTIKNYIDNR